MRLVAYRGPNRGIPFVISVSHLHIGGFSSNLPSRQGKHTSMALAATRSAEVFPTYESQQEAEKMIRG